jgi:transposase
MLSERREDLIKERTRTLNRLHGLLTDLLPGGAPKNLSAEKAARVLRGVRPRSGPARTRRRLAADLLRDIRRLESGSSMNSSAASGRQSKRPPRA